MKRHLNTLIPGLFLLCFLLFVAAHPPASWQPPQHDNTLSGVGTDDELLGVDTDTIHLAPFYEARLTQASTNAPTALVYNYNLSGAAPVWTRDSIGTYKITKTDAFLDSTLVANVTIGSGTAFVAKFYRQSDSTGILRCLAKTGIGADLGGTGYIQLWTYPND